MPRTLFVDQASLTGESLPVEKHAEPQTAPPVDIGALTNICFMGTTVVSGSATGVIALTGARAYFGGLANAMSGTRTPTSFDRGINRFAWLMIRFIFVMAPLVFLINGFTKGNWLEALLFATAVAVGLTPEMLPMIVTVNLAKGAIAMSRKKVIVKRLNAIQNFGAMDVLCTDKTGTLTQDRIFLEKHVDLLGEDSEEVLEYAYLNSYYQSGLKNLLDVAVLRSRRSRNAWPGMRASYQKVDEIPFDFERRRMSVVVRAGRATAHPDLQGRGRGDPRGIAPGPGRTAQIGRPRRRPGAQLARRWTSAERRRLPRRRRRLSRICPRTRTSTAWPTSPGSCWSATSRSSIPRRRVPPRPSRRWARTACRSRSSPATTRSSPRKICRDVGLPVTRVVLGSELAASSGPQLASLVQQAQVFAKLTPLQKASVIRALQGSGRVVGFLGDGINDGPALKAADVGISVDSAVDIAKESADIILLEKSLLVLDQGVIEGRKVFGNVVKYIRMSASSNFGNMFSVIGASAWLPFLPMAPVQVLTNNLLYDFSQTAIPTDNVDEEYLARPRRWEIGNIGRYMLFVGPISSIFDYATYLIMYFVFGASTPARAPLFQTGWFVESLLSQTLIIHVIRTRRLAFIESRASTPLLLTGLATCLAGIWLPYSPFASAFGFVALPARYWPLLGAMLLAYLVLTHLMKTWFHRRFGLD